MQRLFHILRRPAPGPEGIIHAAFHPLENRGDLAHRAGERALCASERFAEAGADVISFHPDATHHVDRTLSLIRDAGCKARLAFNPAEPLDVLEWVIDKVDLVLIMSVNPGFGGQSFIESSLRKIERARTIIDASGRDIHLEVDGGIKTDNIRRVADAGADTFVAGSAIFGQKDYRAVMAAMRVELAAPSLAKAA